MSKRFRTTRMSVQTALRYFGLMMAEAAHHPLGGYAVSGEELMYRNNKVREAIERIINNVDLNTQPAIFLRHLETKLRGAFRRFVLEYVPWSFTVSGSRGVLCLQYRGVQGVAFEYSTEELEYAFGLHITVRNNAYLSLESFRGSLPYTPAHSSWNEVLWLRTSRSRKGIPYAMLDENRE